MFLWLAYLVALIHGLTVAAVVTGSLAAISGRLRRCSRLQAGFYALIGLMIASDVLLGECFLTGLEHRLRALAGPGAAYRNSFIGHYLPWIPAWIHTWVGPALVVA